MSPDARVYDPDGERIFGAGEMAARIRAFDWSATPLGPIARWPQSLVSAVSICLGSRFPIIVWWGPELRLLYNDAYIAMLGRKHPRALGQPGLSAAAWKEIADVIGPRLRGVLAGGEATWEDDQLLIIERNGYPEEAYFTYSYSPIRDEGGEVGGIFAAVSETTGRVLGERRLRTLRDLGAVGSKAKTVAQASSAAVETLAANRADVPFAAVYLVDAAATQAHLAAAMGVERATRAAPASVSLLDDAAEPWPLARVAATRQPACVQGLSRDGDLLPEGYWPDPTDAAMLLPLSAPGQDHLAGILVAGISPRRALDADYRAFLELVAGHIATALSNARAYEEERRRAEALAELDRAKTAFFSNVSHEFRTPLTLMLGPLEDALADSGEKVGPRTQERLSVAHRNSLRLLKLVNSLLDFSRIEAGRVEAAYEPTDIASYTAELASVFRSAIERAGLTLDLDCPPVSADVYVDREMWEKVVLNLLSNAFKFTFAGGISVSLRETAGHVSLVVRDTGTGIAGEELPHVFERFHRVRGARGRTHEGTGIGLALVQEIVKLHGGTVAVESEPGRGTTFTVSIPTGSAHLPAERLGASRTLASTALGAAPFVEEASRWLPEDIALDATATAHAAPLSSRGARVLLADDNQDMRDYVRRLLEAHWEVEAVADGEAALAAASERPFDLVLADVMMPRLDGFELLRALRTHERTRTVPVLLLSARAGEEARVEGLEAGADDYLTKPFSARELVARVHTHLELARVRRDAEASVRSSEERLRTALDIGGIGTWDLDLVSGNATWSDSHYEVFGLDPDGFGTNLENWWRHVHPADKAQVQSDLARAHAEGGEYRGVNRIVRPDGSVRWLEGRGRLFFDDAGRAVRFTGAYVDVSDRKRLEQRLMAQHAVSRVLSQATDLAGSYASVLEALVEHLDWRLAQLWLTNETGSLVCTESRSHGEPTPVLERASREHSLAKGVGLPGRVWAAAEPAWILDVCADDNFPRAPFAAHDGMRSAVGFPILLGDVVLGVIELFCDTMQPPDAELLETLADTGRQLGQFMERMRAEQALRESEQQLADFFDNASLGLHWLGPDGVILRANKAELQLLGYDEDEYVGHHVSEFHADAATARDMLSRLDADEKLDEYPARLRCKDGSVRDVVIDSSVFRDADGRFIHTRCFTRDVTALKDIERTRARLAAIVESSDDAILSQDLAGTVLTWNAGAERIFGYSADEVVGRHISMLAPPHLREDVSAIVERVARGQRVEHYETERVRRDGRRISVALTISPIRDAAGRVIGASKIARDISGRVAAEAEQQRLLNALRDADRRKDEFLAMLAHELRNPLAPIRNAAQIFVALGIDDPPVVRATEIISRQVAHMSRLLDDLLDVSRITSGKVTLRREPVLLADVIGQAVDAMRPVIERHGHTLTVLTDPDALCVSGDDVRLVQVVANLLNNAAKYTEPGGYISVSTAREDDVAVIRVRDTGIGLDAELLPRVFDLFVQGERTIDRREGGLGIGLTLVRRLVELHGGRVEAHSAGSGTGSEFIVTLPALPAARAAVDAENGPAQAALRRPLRILLVEDNVDAAETLRMLLELDGHRVDVVADGRAALEIADRSSADVGLIDIGLPGMDGYELATALRRMPGFRDSALVALSGYGREEDKQAARAAGFDEHLTKPFDLESVRTLLAALTERRRQSARAARGGATVPPLRALRAR